MTPLGFHTAAASEAAALFPLSTAPPPAAENAGAVAAAFGDLLQASFAQAGLPDDAVPAEGSHPTFSARSLSDVWFAGLNVDLDALNAGLEVEEAGVPAAPAIAAAADANATDAAGLMAAAVPTPVAVPAPLPIPVPGAESEALGSKSPLSELLVGPATAPHRPDAMGTPPQGPLGEPEGLAPQANRLNAIAPQGTFEQGPPPTRDAHVGLALSGLPGEAEGLAPQASPVSVAAVVNVASTPVIENPQPTSTLSAAPGESGKVAPEVREGSATPAPAQESSAEALPKEQLPKTLDNSPAMQQTGRTRESVVAKLAEISGLGVSGDAVARPVPGTNPGTDSEPQSQTQDGATQDGFAFVLKESATPVRSADGAAITPVFSVAAPAAGPARAVVVEGATLPPAPPAATVPGPENVGRLIESMRVQMRQGVQEATVRLNPEHLGEVTISVRVERGAVSAVVNAETPAVQQWLESQEDKLRSGLSDQGLHLAKFIVQRDGAQQHREQPQQQKQPARDRQQLDGAPIRFEVIV